MKHIKLFESYDSYVSSKGGKFSINVIACDRYSSNITNRRIYFNNADEFNELMNKFEEEVPFIKLFFDFDLLEIPSEIEDLPISMKNQIVTPIQDAIEDWV